MQSLRAIVSLGHTDPYLSPEQELKEGKCKNILEEQEKGWDLYIYRKVMCHPWGEGQ